jgi:PIN domain nuclease of toxin-antitoxin system
VTALLLDTGAMIALATGDRLSREAKDMIEAALGGGETLAVSPYSAWEVGARAARGDFVFSQKPESWFNAFVGRAGMSLAPLPPSVLVAASFLPGSPPADLADRVIVATAREFGMTLLTRDRALLDYAAAGHINAIEC